MKRLNNWFAIGFIVFTANNFVMADTGIDDQTVSQSFRVQAGIINGCILGGGASSVSDYGTISFGDITSLNQDKDVTSSNNAGSIVIKCTPGTTVSIALNSGSNASGSIASGRLLKNINSNETLKYQLFQEGSFSTIWGNDSNGGNVKTISATGTIESYPIYARLFANNIMPSAGIYTDTITVTISY